MLIQVPMFIDDTATFYTRVDAYLKLVDPTYEPGDEADTHKREREALPPILGSPDGRSVLDLPCGAGSQTLALASLGWQVTGLDITPAFLDIAHARAAKLNLSPRLEQHDARTPLPADLAGQFDVSISCMALDNIIEEVGFTQAIANLYCALKPGGLCYIRLRHIDFVLEFPQSRYDYSWERNLPHGRLIRLEDWIPLDVTFLPHEAPWFPYEVTARR